MSEHFVVADLVPEYFVLDECVPEFSIHDNVGGLTALSKMGAKGCTIACVVVVFFAANFEERAFEGKLCPLPFLCLLSFSQFL